MANSRYNRYRGDEYREDFYLDEFNCGSYALGTEEWFSPYDDDEVREDEVLSLIDAGYTKDEVMDILLEHDTKEILRLCEWIEEVEYNGQPEEGLIAYRVYVNDEAFEDEYFDLDFHFRVFKNGRWHEKCGAGPIERCRQKDIFSTWIGNCDICYTGPIRFFRVKQ